MDAWLNQRFHAKTISFYIVCHSWSATGRSRESDAVGAVVMVQLLVEGALARYAQSICRAHRDLAKPLYTEGNNQFLYFDARTWSGLCLCIRGIS